MKKRNNSEGQHIGILLHFIHHCIKFFALSSLIKRGFIYPEFAVSVYRTFQQFEILWAQSLKLKNITVLCL